MERRFEAMNCPGFQRSVGRSPVLSMHGRILICPGQGSWPSEPVPLLSHPSHLQNDGKPWG